MQKGIKIISPCGILGYGFPEQPFLDAFNEKIHGIVVDAGSTDAGPHKLGANVSIVSRRALKKDLSIILQKGLTHRIPVIIGSSGGAGAKKHVELTVEIVREILAELNTHARIGIIWADFKQQTIIDALKEGRITPLSSNIPNLTIETILDTKTIVAQMGHEPILKALRQRCDIILCGRSYDPSPFAALGIYHGMDPGLSYHLGKILECGALCAEPGTTKDGILGTLYRDSFTVQALNPMRKCTPTSVAAHTFYEKEHPFILHGPGFKLNLENCEFNEAGDGVIEVRNSQYIADDEMRIKLEGARKIAYRTFVIAGIRDPLLINQLEEVEKEVVRQVRNYFAEISVNDYKINFYHYGKDAVLGEQEPSLFFGHEIGVMFEVLAKDQELANAICANVRSTFLHFGYVGRKSTAGNLAFPFAPSDIEFGPVYEFSIYHLMRITQDPFLLEIVEV
ncbi:acyclic terpene utilization AtuA family protein [Ureibacillus aquaedulcis]|uniref:Acyclic terpene utilization AtuA family protein n=1 Tax=Ureibacillus aquaedulcis TaxID=3058421 RepID=A0ABT8GQH2_9BACL|nr:acyclic terpene utilization AtuA family protein [Ureibacillus sp. BA0131]MDN4493659.1 acyclic terpene utilization AtuA family protein [Ureibacillus sp. BA0131]